MSAVQVVFLVLAAVCVFSGLQAVTCDRLVHAALWFVLTLGALAGTFLLLAAELLAWVQVLVYLGSVVVLLVFALMLTRAPTGPGSATLTGNRWVAAVLSVATSLGLGVLGWTGFAGQQVVSPTVGSPEVIGQALFTQWVLPFEILSVVLLAALVGAIALSTGQRTAGDSGASDGDV
ncbi:NADH-quinone oxidoreductase subunit J [Solicola sp. PLA-1-18]|uniref:NADH-quinone oxidoreductase subunit J family protein n=1 Tax=Solicola sp. PLA-1-18 TaxID=3380532 RepID=UPI003B7D4ADA